MKKLIMLSAIVMCGLVSTANAQIGIHVGFNLGVRPVYAPAPVVQDQPVYQDDASGNYDDDYYYLPDVGAYYSVAEQCYYYNDGDRWISAAYLPGEYRNYDWRYARRFEVRAHRPFMHDEFYRSRYNGFEGRRDWNHFDGRGYANADRFNHGNQAPHHFDNRGFDKNQGGFQQRGNFNGGQQFQNRGFEGNENRGNQQINQNRGSDRNNEGSGRPMNQNHGSDRNNNQGGGQLSNEHRGFQGGDTRGGQPANQHQGAERGNNQNGGQHFAGNNAGNDNHGFAGHRGF